MKARSTHALVGLCGNEQINTRGFTSALSQASTSPAKKSSPGSFVVAPGSNIATVITLAPANPGPARGIGIDVDVEERLVARGHREGEIRDAARGAVAMVARVVRRFGQLRDGDVGTRQVGIAEAEVDHVATVGTRV